MRLNTLDSLILKSFVRPFVPTLLIMVFLFMMQMVWKYIEDIAGRGIEWYYIAELLLFWSAGVIPMALPIAVLLASLMTIGNFGENYELAAMKSAGVSLFRVMRPMFFIMIFVSGGAFVFYNYIIPVANLKAINLINNISRQKPAFQITPGVFYSGIENFSIKIGSKDEDNQNILRDIYIYDHREQQGNTKVTVAKQGEMRIIGNDEYLELRLEDGYIYENILPKSRRERSRLPFVKAKFEESIVRFNLKDFQTDDLREGNLRNFYMLNTTQLMEEADSIRKNFEERKENFTETFSKRYAFQQEEVDSIGNNKAVSETDIYIDKLPPAYQNRAIQNAIRMARSNREYLIQLDSEFKWRKELMARHYLEWHKKFALSAACLVLFFIGAPLGAIIRKGGLGMPVVVSVVIFVIFHILNMMFEKLGRELVLEPWLAIWLPTIILAPVGIFLTQRAATDSGLMSAESYTNIFRRIRSIFIKKKEDEASPTEQ